MVKKAGWAAGTIGALFMLAGVPGNAQAGPLDDTARNFFGGFGKGVIAMTDHYKGHTRIDLDGPMMSMSEAGYQGYLKGAQCVARYVDHKMEQGQSQVQSVAELAKSSCIAALAQAVEKETGIPAPARQKPAQGFKKNY